MGRRACGFPSPADVNLPVATGPRPQNEPAVAVNPLAVKNLVVTAHDFSAGGRLRIGAYRSCDGGVSFARTLLPLPPGLDTGSDGVVAAGFPGGSTDPGRARFLIVSLAFRAPGRGGAILAYRSDDAGARWRRPVVVARGYGDRAFNDKPALAVDRSPASPRLGHAYVAYTRYLNREQANVLFFQRSADGGRIWSRPLRLTRPGTAVQGAALAVGPLGEVYAAWIDFAPGRPRLRVRRSDHGGRRFGPAVTAAEIALVPSPLPVPGWRFRVPTFAFLAADITTGPGSGSVYAVWQDYRRGDAHILLTHSRARGRTWREPRRVSDSPPGTQEFFPNIAVSPITGAVQVIYYTNRLSPRRLDLFAAAAPPGAGRFPVQRRVTDRSSDPNADRPARHFIGDYIGVAPRHPDGIVAVWTDTRTGSQDIWIGE